ncbi:hypothetical protein C9374_014611 [Naegleria lovaniensis]|uniref:Uncharacterized protein n=1 Tax=Naegleria lovaniensis TaxID=51637 RepID=A0AA88H050_NAELO|nr:uncharacterized protein C9374_014611 [Naegleria lovaniensis]KAG2389211.1 hypothetical protein C9374_014611 [Naegleria lovaniensis]
MTSLLRHKNNNCGMSNIDNSERDALGPMNTMDEQEDMIDMDNCSQQEFSELAKTSTSSVFDHPKDGLNTERTSSLTKTNNKIEKRRKMLQQRKAKIVNLKKRWRERNAALPQEQHQLIDHHDDGSKLGDLLDECFDRIEKTIVQNVEGKISTAFKKFQESMTLAFGECLQKLTSAIEMRPSSLSTPIKLENTQPTSLPSIQVQNSQNSQSQSNIMASSSYPSKHQHGSKEEDCWIIWNNSVYDKLRLLRRMKAIKYNEWEDFVERDAIIWRRHFELRDQFKRDKSSDKKHYTLAMDYISPVLHAKQFLGKTLQKIRQGFFKNKEVSNEMLTKMLEGVSKGNILPYQQDLLLSKKEIQITPKSKINSPFWWLNLEIYQQLSLLVELKIIAKTDWNAYMKKVMQLNDSITEESERAPKIISFGETLMKNLKDKTPTDKWFLFVQKKQSMMKCSD